MICLKSCKRFDTPEQAALGIKCRLLKQSVPYTIEEAYEVAEAITRNDMQDLCVMSLGTLLLQVVYHAQMAEEKNQFSFDDVVEGDMRKND